MPDEDVYLKKQCRYSGKSLPKAFLDLGFSPLANSFVPKGKEDQKEFQCPLRLTRCPESGLVQLTHVVPPDLLFSHYLYVSSTTKTFRDHFADYARAVKSYLCADGKALAVDIGSNDGLLVACYENEGMRGVGVDPAKNLAEEANRQGRVTLNRYFDDQAVDAIIKDYGHAHVVSGNNVFAHIDDIQGVCRNVTRLLDPKGFFVIEFPYLVTMLKELLFDMVYHEHLSYIAVHPLQYLLKQHELEIFDIQYVASHGGSLRVFSQKQGGPRSIAPVVQEYLNREREEGYLEEDVYLKFAEQVAGVKKELMSFVEKIKREGKTIAGYGAPAKATTIISYCGFTPEQIDFVVDDNSLKQDHYVPGAKIPVVPSSHLHANPTDYVIIFAWNFAREIMQKNLSLAEKGVQFIVPLPKPTLVDSKTLTTSTT